MDDDKPVLDQTFDNGSSSNRTSIPPRPPLPECLKNSSQLGSGTSVRTVSYNPFDEDGDEFTAVDNKNITNFTSINNHQDSNQQSTVISEPKEFYPEFLNPFGDEFDDNCKQVASKFENVFSKNPFDSDIDDDLNVHDSNSQLNQTHNSFDTKEQISDNFIPSSDVYSNASKIENQLTVGLEHNYDPSPFDSSPKHTFNRITSFASSADCRFGKISDAKLLDYKQNLNTDSASLFSCEDSTVADNRYSLSNTKRTITKRPAPPIPIQEKRKVRADTDFDHLPYSELHKKLYNIHRQTAQVVLETKQLQSRIKDGML